MQEVVSADAEGHPLECVGFHTVAFGNCVRDLIVVITRGVIGRVHCDETVSFKLFTNKFIIFVITVYFA